MLFKRKLPEPRSGSLGAGDRLMVIARAKKLDASEKFRAARLASIYFMVGGDVKNAAQARMNAAKLFGVDGNQADQMFRRDKMKDERKNRVVLARNEEHVRDISERIASYLNENFDRKDRAWVKEWREKIVDQPFFAEDVRGYAPLAVDHLIDQSIKQAVESKSDALPAGELDLIESAFRHHYSSGPILHALLLDNKIKLA
jgi:hypothetical protein